MTKRALSGKPTFKTLLPIPMLRHGRKPKEVNIYPRIFPSLEDWPIYRLSEDRDNFIEDIKRETRIRLLEQHGENLSDLIVKTLYQERIRLREEPWRVDPPDEKPFWNSISKKLITKTLDKDKAEAHETSEKLLSQILDRYAEEIVGTFNRKVYHFVVPALTALFNRLLNAAVNRSFLGIFRGRKQLYERFDVQGDIETVRALFAKGTVVVVPTHFSNLDSIMVGYAMDQVMGLPSFSYGAGLNLYNFGPAAYFMNRMGAYRLDRRKKNPVYLETLKTMSELSIKRGVNSLFFPGGTRSRSGAVESKLKAGLLGTALNAQRSLCQEGSDKKVFIVPMVIGYHFVLEAPFMIEQYLRDKGKENYLFLKDEGASIRTWSRYIWSFLSTVNDISLSVGRPMDVLGNFVDAEGNSLDKYGRHIDIRDYFSDAQGQLVEDPQREAEYTRHLAQRITERYKIENVVLSSHLVAFAVFRFLMHQNPKLDLFGLLRLPPDDYVFPYEVIEEAVEQMQKKLLEMGQKGELELSEILHDSPGNIVKDGIKRLGVFHQKKPLMFNKAGDIESDSFRTLYYYHNRLDMYGLERYVEWKTVEIQAFSHEKEVEKKKG